MTVSFLLRLRRLTSSTIVAIRPPHRLLASSTFKTPTQPLPTTAVPALSHCGYSGITTAVAGVPPLLFPHRRGRATPTFLSNPTPFISALHVQSSNPTTAHRRRSSDISLRLLSRRRRRSSSGSGSSRSRSVFIPMISRWVTVGFVAIIGLGFLGFYVYPNWTLLGQLKGLVKKLGDAKINWDRPFEGISHFHRLAQEWVGRFQKLRSWLRVRYRKVCSWLSFLMEWCKKIAITCVSAVLLALIFED